MGCAFTEIIETHRDEILLVMQAYTIPEEGIRDHVRNLYITTSESLTLKFERAGLPNPAKAATDFIGTGLLITLAEILDLPQLIGKKEQ